MQWNEINKIIDFYLNFRVSVCHFATVCHGLAVDVPSDFSFINFWLNCSFPGLLAFDLLDEQDCKWSWQFPHWSSTTGAQWREYTEALASILECFKLASEFQTVRSGPLFSQLASLFWLESSQTRFRWFKSNLLTSWRESLQETWSQEYL